jgi:hypothetical protein
MFEGICLPPLKSLPVPWKEGCVGGAKISRLKIFFYRLIEGNAKGCHLKKLTCKGTLGQVFICRRPRTPYPPPLHIVYVYTVLINTGQGRGESCTREKGIWACVENTNMTNQSINSDKHLPQSPLKGNFFR